MEEKKKPKLKIIIPIVIIVIVALAVVGIVVLGNGNKETNTNNKVYKVGDTIRNDNFEMTLKSVDFVDFVNLETQLDAKYKQNRYGTDNFLLSIESEGPKLTPKENETILSYSLEYKFIGKNEYYAYNPFANPIVKYDNDYTFTENYLIASNNGNGWSIISIDQNEMRISDIYYSSQNYQPLDTTTYLVRGAIIVPAELKNNTEKSLTIQFNKLGNGTYKIR